MREFKGHITEVIDLQKTVPDLIDIVGARYQVICLSGRGETFILYSQWDYSPGDTINLVDESAEWTGAYWQLSTVL